MPTIVSICPYCRAGGVRAPQSNIGASATCPNCKSSFTVMPSDGLPGWARDPQPAPVPSKPQAAPTDETRPAAAVGMADVTEPSPLLPDDERSQVESRPATVPAAPALIEEPDEESVPADIGWFVALAALILVGVAVVASQLPYGRIIGAAIALAGVIGGLASLGAEGRSKLAAGLAIALNGLVLVVVVLLPSWL